MILPTVLLLGSVCPAFLLKVKDMNIMEGTLQKYVEDFMAYYGNSTGLRHSLPPQRIRTVFGINQQKKSQKNAAREEKVTPSSIDGNRNKKEILKNRHKKIKLRKRERKTRPKSQPKNHASTQPHGHAYEFDGAFDPFPLWEYSGW